MPEKQKRSVWRCAVARRYASWPPQNKNKLARNSIRLFIPMQLPERLKEKGTELLLAGLVGSLGYLLTIVWTEFSAPFFQKVLPEISNKALFAIALTLLVLLLISCFTIVLLIRAINDKLKLRFGVYWDKKKNPHCPGCKKPISDYRQYGTHFGYGCMSCNRTILLERADGTPITAQEAMNSL
jgi:hypothetical protein